MPDEQIELVACDGLADVDRLVLVQTETFDGIAGAAHLAHDVADRYVRKVLKEALREGRPVRVTGTAAPAEVGSGRVRGGRHWALGESRRRFGEGRADDRL